MMDIKKVFFINYQYKSINSSCEIRSQSSVVCIVTRLWAGWLWVWTQVSTRDFFPSPKCPDWFSGPTNLLYIGVPGFFPVVKWPGCDINHSPPSGAKVTNEWCYISAPIYVFMVWARKTLPYYLFRVVWSSSVASHWLQKCSVFWQFSFCSTIPGKSKVPFD